MAEGIADRCYQTSVSIGNGVLTFAPSTAVSKHQTFLAGWGASGSGWALIVNDDANEWEVAWCVLNAGGTTITPTSDFSGTNGASAVSFGFGTKHIEGVASAALLKVLLPLRTAWAAYTVNTPGASGGALGAGGTYTGAFKQIGKTVFFRVKLVITDIGTATGYLTFNAPVTAAAQNLPIPASNASNTNLNCNLGASSTTCYLLKYDGTSPIAVNEFYINGSYEAA